MLFSLSALLWLSALDSQLSALGSPLSALPSDSRVRYFAGTGFDKIVRDWMLFENLMLALLGRPRSVCNGLTRRQVLQVGGAGLFGLNLPKLLAAEDARLSEKKSRAKSVLFVFLYGGPSQLETFDMKPDAPSTIRGPFRTIASRTPDLRVCEHLPRLAARSDQFCVIRTMNHPQNDHNGTHYIQTGHPLPPAHWSYCFPCILAGAGIRGGVAFGKLDNDAAWPIDSPVTPEDMACTIFHALGIDPHAHLLRDKQDRPVALVDGGRVLNELCS